MVKQKASEVNSHGSHGCSEHLSTLSDLGVSPTRGAGGEGGELTRQRLACV